MAPQIIYLALIFMNLGIYYAKHGEEKEGKYDGRVETVSVILTLALLWWGGFFEPFFN